jgi:hypothetical protein
LLTVITVWFISFMWRAWFRLFSFWNLIIFSVDFFHFQLLSRLSNPLVSFLLLQMILSLFFKLKVSFNTLQILLQFVLCESVILTISLICNKLWKIHRNFCGIFHLIFSFVETFLYLLLFIFLNCEFLFYYTFIGNTSSLKLLS